MPKKRMLAGRKATGNQDPAGRLLQGDGAG